MNKKVISPRFDLRQRWIHRVWKQDWRDATQFW